MKKKKDVIEEEDEISDGDRDRHVHFSEVKPEINIGFEKDIEMGKMDGDVGAEVGLLRAAQELNFSYFVIGIYWDHCRNKKPV